MQIKDYPINLKNYILRPFFHENILDQRADVFMCNLLLFFMLDQRYDGYQEQIYALERGYHPRFLTKDASKILQKMQEGYATGTYYGSYLNSYVKVKRK